MDDKVAKQLIKALNDNTKAVRDLVKLQSRTSRSDRKPKQPEGTTEVRGD